MLYDSYEQVVLRDRPAYWYRPRHASTTALWRNLGKSGTSQGLSSPSGSTSEIGGPGIPGAADGVSTRVINPPGIARGWRSGEHALVGSSSVGLTLEVWMCPAEAFVSSRRYGLLVRHNTSLNYYRGIMALDGGILGDIDGGEEFYSADRWQLFQWTHCVLIIRALSSEFYVNGQRITNARAGNPSTRNVGSTAWESYCADGVTFGAAYQNDFQLRYPFPGYVAEPAIYEYALSPSQIQDHYQAGIMPRRSTSRLLSAMYPFAGGSTPPPPPGGLTAITEGLPNKRVLLVSDRPR